MCFVIDQPFESYLSYHMLVTHWPPARSLVKEIIPFVRALDVESMRFLSPTGQTSVRSGRQLRTGIYHARNAVVA